MSKRISSVTLPDKEYQEVVEIKEKERRGSLSNAAATLIIEALEAREQKGQVSKKEAAPPTV